MGMKRNGVTRPFFANAHPRKEKRDGLQRMQITAYADDSLVTLRLLNKEGTWKIDNFRIENNDSEALVNQFNNDKNFLSYILSAIERSQEPC